MIDERLRVPFAKAGCKIHRVHLPRPVGSELHHVFPKYLQARVRATSEEVIALCPTGHADVHYALEAMLALRPMPRGVGRSERALAEKALWLYTQAGGKL